MSRPALVGLLKAQTEPYLQTLETIVHSCQKTKGGYLVEFEDTVLFPEGGGQPYDTGRAEVLNSSSPAATAAPGDGDLGHVAAGVASAQLVDAAVAITNVQRDGLRAVHTADRALAPGAAVRLTVDWARRWDHMQQHTGQHLLSAVLDRRKVATVGWALGAGQCYVELDRKLATAEVAAVQAETNALIRESRPITLSYGAGDAESHNVPENYDLEAGVLRVISIDGIDRNPCCGTHLRTTADIQAIVLLHQVPNKGNSRLFFIAGERVIQQAAANHAKLRSINALLSCQTEDIEEKISQLNAKSRAAQSLGRTLAAQLAPFEARDLADRAAKGARVVVLHKPDLDFDYLRLVEKELAGKAGNFVLFSGQTGQPGAVIVVGDDAPGTAKLVTDRVPTAKGGGKGRWQGKVVKFGKGEVDSLICLETAVV